MADIFGTPGDDTLTGSPLDDVITTYEGDDTVDAGDGDDIIIVDENSEGLIDGGEGFDIVRVVSGSNLSLNYSNAGSSQYLPTNGSGYSLTDIERIEVISTAGILKYLTIFGRDTDDTLDISSENNTNTAYLLGGAGDDILIGGTSYSVLIGGVDNDTLTTGSGGGRLRGEGGADVLSGGTGNDLLDYQSSNAAITIDLTGATANTGGEAEGDTFIGSFELVFASEYDDVITGSNADEDFYGFSGADTIYGGDGEDRLFGGLGGDSLFGDLGDDVISGGDGVDNLTGGAGNDTFQFFGYDISFEDIITDFTIGDVIEISRGYINGNFLLPTFIGAATFSGVMGEMRYEKIAGQTLLHIDTDGDSATDYTATIANDELNLVMTSVSASSFDLQVQIVVSPNIVTTTADEVAEDTDLQTQGNDGGGLSLREAIAIANTTAAADVISYDAGVLANAIINTSPNGTIEISEDLTLSTGVDVFHEAGNPIFDVTNGATLVSNANIFTDSTNAFEFPNQTPGILISGNNSTFTNNGTINTNGFNEPNNDRTPSIEIDGTNAIVNNSAGASIVSQGRYAIYSFAFDDVTNDYIPDFLTVNNDGLLEAADDTIRIGTGVINNTGTIRSLGLLDFGGFWDPVGLASDAIAIVNQLDASFVPSADGVLVINNSATGLIEGLTRAGINFSGGGTINNAGTITGDTTGLFTQGFNDFSNIFVLNNSGTVSAGSGDYGLFASGLRGGVTIGGGLDLNEVTNSGTISSGYYGIYSDEAITLVNTSTGQIIGDTDGTGDDEVSFRGSVLDDFEVEAATVFNSPFGVYNIYSSQGITQGANGDLVTSVGTYEVQGQLELVLLSGVDANYILPLVDLAATQTAGFIVFQTDANGTVYPSSVSLPTTNNGTLTVTFTSGQPAVVTDVNGDTVYTPSQTGNYDDSIDNNGFMSGDIITGLGNDAIINRGNIDGDIYLGTGNDNYTAGAAGLSGDIYGGDGNDVVNARTGVQAIFGEDGNDFLRGGEGDDSLHGGFGADWLRGGTGADVLNGFAGTDWADYITSASAVTVDLLAGTGTGGEAQGDTYLFIERVYGSNHDDSITGDTGVNYLRGAGGNDMLFGGGGTDYLQGDAGADALNGGAGGDYAYYVSSAIGLTIDLGNTANNTGEAIGDTYTSIENIVGTRFDDIITGDAANNFLRGLQGNDTLNGGDGADFLRGDQGADVLDGGNGLDWAYYATSSSAVTVDLGAGTASGGHAAGDSFISIERVYGSNFADNITGDTGANYLRGSGGNDTLNGGAGADFLQGDSGADVLDGGTGTDWAYYASSKTGVTIDLGNAVNNTGEAAGDSYISIENIVGSRFDDSIMGDASNNYLRGYLGDDIINGGAGNDTLRGDAGADTFVFEVGTGGDKVIDYVDADDMLDFSSFGFTDVNDALSNAVDTVGGDVVFTIGSDEITIENTTIQEITDNMIV